MADAKRADGAATVKVTVVVCTAPREIREWVLEMPAGASVADALLESGADQVCKQGGMDATRIGIWGRTTTVDTTLVHLDRVEVYRSLKVDPKVARRERFARQGARTTGLFARQRPGGKSGY